MAKQDSEEVLQELTSLIGKDKARVDSKGRKHLTVMGASGASRIPWFEHFTPEEIEAQFAENYRRIKKAEASIKKPNRPLNALLIATSGRNDKLSCAHEKSRSTEVLNVARKRLEELGVKEITSYDLWDLNIEHCNGCYGCFVDPDIRVLSSRGWKPISKAKKRTSLLSHAGKFQRVIGERNELPGHVYSGELVVVTYCIEGTSYRVRVTPDHRFLEGSGAWIRADNLRPDNELKWVGKRCKVCSKPFSIDDGHTYNGKFIRRPRHLNVTCSKECADVSRANSPKGHRDPRKGKTMEEYYGKDRGLALRKAAGDVSRRTAEQRAEKLHGVTLEDRFGKDEADRIKSVARERMQGKTFEELFGEETATLAKKKMSAASTGVTWEERFGVERASELKHVAFERLLANKLTKDTSIERAVESWLLELGVSFEKQWHYRGGVADFYLADHNLVIECDGCYWHACPDCFSEVDDDEEHFGFKKCSRNQILRRQSVQHDNLSASGIGVVRLWEHAITGDRNGTKAELCGLLQNHEGQFEQFVCDIIAIEREQVSGIELLCPSVDVDHSFLIDGGLVSHNSEDYWCHWPCTCWPFDDGQKIYEAVIRADIIVFGSPVNEATAASRFYEMWHRMICVDGGMDFKPPPGWEKSKEELNKLRQQRGHGAGLEQIRRFLGKKIGFIILGHELGAQLAASTIHASAQYRGAYIPTGAQVAKIYRGSGPNSTDRETLHNTGVFRRELMDEVNDMCEQLVRAAKLDRKQPHKEEPAERS